MERNGVGMITNRYRAQDYLDLQLEVDSEDGKWETAIEIFTDRFTERYFDPVCDLQKNSEKNGFAIMALNCLLIDTFYQFEEGVEETTKNKACYTKFLQEHLSEIVSSSVMAMKFYKDIRCGILHSAQTKNGSMLSTESEIAIEFINGKSSIKVNVNMFSEEMKRYFESYIVRLRYGDKKTRENFITKMYYICL